MIFFFIIISESEIAVNKPKKQWNNYSNHEIGPPDTTKVAKQLDRSVAHKY